jgi:hypothetical protein
LPLERHRFRLKRLALQLFRLEHDLFGKPVSTSGSSPGAGFFRIMLFWLEHDLFGKPVSTFPDHAVLAGA